MSAVTVIICTWNRVGQLAVTLNSLALQVGIAAKKVQVVVVDNNSNDSTRDFVSARAELWPLGSLEYVLEPRQGKQFALNRGLAQARHPVLAFTDDDIILEPDWLAQALRAIGQGNVHLLGGRTEPVWPDGGAPAWFAPDMMAVLGGIDLGPHRLEPAPADYAPAGANLIALRSLFDRMKGFSEAHYRHMDHEFGMRCQAAGVRIAYDPTVRVRAPVDPECLTREYFRRWAFKSGIAVDARDVNPGSGPAVPLWVYRQALTDFLAARVLMPAKLQPQSFSQEFRFWRHWGAIASGWRRWLAPANYSDWVIRRSQKKDNRQFG